jgi:hypothetical protein
VAGRVRPADNMTPRFNLVDLSSRAASTTMDFGLSRRAAKVTNSLPAITALARSAPSRHRYFLTLSSHLTPGLERATTQAAIVTFGPVLVWTTRPGR